MLKVTVVAVSIVGKRVTLGGAESVQGGGDDAGLGVRTVNMEKGVHI